MSKRKEDSGLHRYLDASGVLAAGSPEDIAAAKKSYWREYKAQWKREKRKEGKVFAVLFADQELKAIVAAAKRHNRSTTRYIREAALAYGAQRFVVPDAAAISAIRELLMQVYATLDALIHAQDVESVTGVSLLQYMTDIEKRVLAALTQPTRIDDPQNMDG